MVSTPNKKLQANYLVWLTNALWSYCRRNDHVPDKLERHGINNNTAKIKLNIPDTILFQDGFPQKWLRTNENGKRRYFHCSIMNVWK